MGRTKVNKAKMLRIVINIKIADKWMVTIYVSLEGAKHLDVDLRLVAYSLVVTCTV